MVTNERRKPIVLVFARYYLPGFRAGGPIRTLANVIDQLGDEFDFYVVTQDHDHGDLTPYPGISTETWISVGKAKVYYVRWQIIFSISNLIRLIRSIDCDIVYHNSYFNPLFTLQYFFARRFGLIPDRVSIIAPRGEFSIGALKIKRIRKLIYIKIVRMLRFFDRLYWQASSPFEAEDIRRVMKVQVAGGSIGWIKTVGNLVVAPDLIKFNTSKNIHSSAIVRPHTPLQICFLSRVCEMKNLTFALKALASVRSCVHFNIYGPKEDDSYWKKCESLIKDLPGNVSVKYMGAVAPDNVYDVMRQHDLFLLPTLGENFGHVIFEALTAGLPLLISDRTPWRNLEEKGVGWDLALENPAYFAEKIDEVSSWTTREYEVLEKSIDDCLLFRGNDLGAVVANRNLFLDALEHSLRIVENKTI
jgi:glycosyltransferase involved in cell wall biosynthesis